MLFGRSPKRDHNQYAVPQFAMNGMCLPDGMLKPMGASGGLAFD